MTRLLADTLDASDVFLMTFMILQDSYMEPTHVGSDILAIQHLILLPEKCLLFASNIHSN